MPLDDMSHAYRHQVDHFTVKIGHFMYLIVKPNILGVFTLFLTSIRRAWAYTNIQTEYFISAALKVVHSLSIICREVKSHSQTNRGKNISLVNGPSYKCSMQPVEKTG